MRIFYNQQSLSVVVDGVKLMDFADQTPVSLTVDGGVVSKTMGADGPSINRSTVQGGTLVINMKETSASLEFLQGLFLRQQQAGRPGVSVVVRTGAEILVELRNSHLSQPGQLQTGGKQWGIYHIRSFQLNWKCLIWRIRTTKEGLWQEKLI